MTLRVFSWAFFICSVIGGVSPLWSWKYTWKYDCRPPGLTLEGHAQARTARIRVTTF